MRDYLHVNDILIERSAEAVHDYVAQPWRWHEWHPASESATQGQRALSVGAQFDETASMQAMPPLPLRIRSQLHWTVLESTPPTLLALRATSNRIDVQVRYEIERGAQTRFRRVFHFQVKGPLRWIAPLFLPARMRAQSIIALDNLKRVLEAQQPVQGGQAQ